MKTTIYQAFDKADAAELAPFLRRNGAPTIRRDTLEAVRRRVFEKNGLQERKRKPIFRRPQMWAAAAACLCLAAGVLFASGLLSPGVHPDAEEPLISYYQVGDLYLRSDFQQIVWGQQRDDADTPAPNVPVEDPEGNGGSCIVDPTVQKDGLLVSLSLCDRLSQLSPDTPVAIGVSRLEKPSHTLAEHVYQGRSYQGIQQDFQQSRALCDKLTELKRLSGRYQSESFKSEDDVFTFWEKLYDAVGEELVAKYFSGEKISGHFDTTAISNDLNACETEKAQLENDLEACWRDWYAECAALPELERLQMKKGYYVVKRGYTYAIILPAGQFAAFAADTLELFGQADAQAVLFRLATRAELGMDECDDVADIPLPEAPPTEPEAFEEDTALDSTTTPVPIPEDS